LKKKKKSAILIYFYK
jgi:hypothetical protein